MSPLDRQPLAENPAGKTHRLSRRDFFSSFANGLHGSALAYLFGRDLIAPRSLNAAGPGTGGHDYDIVPGHPEESILVFRISSTDPEIKMPELPNKIVDKRGVELVSEWITGMTPEGCPE